MPISSGAGPGAPVSVYVLSSSWIASEMVLVNGDRSKERGRELSVVGERGVRYVLRCMPVVLRR
jgi:hypothetical protein